MNKSKKIKKSFFIHYFLKVLLIVLTVLLVSAPAAVLGSCDNLRQSLLEKVEKDKSGTAEIALDSSSAAESSQSLPETASELQDTEETLSKGNDSAENSGTGPAGTDMSSKAETEDNGSADNVNIFGVGDIEGQRDFFIKGVEAFQEKNYIIAEYYLNKVKDTYLVLADHVLYYYAKSLLMQNKFDNAEENYLKIKNNFPDSVFTQKAYLEYADLFFIKQDYINAELGYENFLKAFSDSDTAPYCRFQLAVCQEKNNKFSGAYDNYKKIWLENPESEYAEKSYDAILLLADKKISEEFIPTNAEIYSRGEKFFNLYRYENAITEFKKIIVSLKSSSPDSSLEAKTIFKMGMCYFNLRDYSSSGDYLLSCYKKFPSGSYADDSLYFLGRVETNLDRETEALKYYNDLLKNFPQSNYADDGLYRAGRIYFFKNDFENASGYYQRIVNEYPSGDMISSAYWELGWIQYKSDDFSNASNTFSGMAVKFQGGQFGEKAMFWQAKCYEKLGEADAAIAAYKKIIGFNSYSYYTFAAYRILGKEGINETIPAINKDAYPDNPDIAEILPEIYDDILNDSGQSKDTQIQPDETNNTNQDQSLESGTSTKNTDNENLKQVPEFTHTDKAKELLFIEFYESADVEIGAAGREFENDNYGILQVSTLYLMAKDYINSQKIISEHYSKLKSSLVSPYKDYFYYLIYPYGFKEFIDRYSAQFGVDPLFVLAVIREESRFNPEAGSYAGALGLMQIIPGTGKGIANSLGIKNFSTDMLLDAETSIKMGSYYLSRQLESFNQNKYYASGAYNGGPGAMSRWISLYGSKDIDEFIEYIPYDETRNYVKKVMASYFFYQMLYG